MKETGILFKPEMICAYFKGLKTQTRRLVKPRMIGQLDGGTETICGIPVNHPNAVTLCPYGRAGDLLWSRETIGYPLDGGSVIYRADGGWAEVEGFAKQMLKGGKWTPAIHQPRIHSRASMILTAVRVERLHDISEEDALAEGIEFFTQGDQYEGGVSCHYKDYLCKGIKADDDGEEVIYNNTFEDDPISSFKSLICSINGKDAWDSNPWVWVLEFPRFTAGL